MDSQTNQQSSGQVPPAPSPAPAASKNTLMGVLAYVSILVIIPLLTAKDDPFVKFHVKQGVVLAVIGIAVWVLHMFLFSYVFWALLNLINLGVVILSIVGIINVVQGKEKELPLVGKFGEQVKL